MSGKLIPGDELSTEMDKIIASLDLAQAQKTWSEQWQAGHPEWEEPHATQGGFLTLDNGDVVGFFLQHQKPETGNAGRIFAVNQRTGEAFTAEHVDGIERDSNGKIILFGAPGVHIEDPTGMLPDDKSGVVNFVLREASYDAQRLLHEEDQEVTVVADTQVAAQRARNAANVGKGPSR